MQGIGIGRVTLIVCLRAAKILSEVKGLKAVKICMAMIKMGIPYIITATMMMQIAPAAPT